MPLFLRQSVLSLLLATALAIQPVSAQGGAGRAQDSYSVDEVTRMIRERGGWKVLSAQTMRDEKGRANYRFKLLHRDGRVKVLSVDPRSPDLGKLK
ncbi:MAG: hypothetical protein U9Q71_00705 [Pseudomonadota bacterium]|nr:hypothetical protein [Pseudomonadota bacterium]